MESAQLFALGLALAWLAGMRVYLTVFGIGLAGALGWVDLPSGLEVASSPWVLGTAGILMLIEFSADKIPGVDSAWDLFHTVVRVPAGAFVASMAVSDTSESGLGMMLAGGGMALASHLLKTGSRVAINTSPEPASNIGASLGGDAVAVTALAFVFAYPMLVLGGLLAFGLVLAVTLAWVASKIVRRKKVPPAPA